MRQMRVWMTIIVLVSLPVSLAASSSGSSESAEPNSRFAEIDEERYYMWTRDDLRMCPSPICGGFFVKALNRLWTRCTDGNKAADCQVLQLDFSGLDMDETEQAVFQQAFTDGLGIIKGKLIQAQLNGFQFPVLKIFEAWRAQVGKEPRNWGYFQVHDMGIRCITTPCLSVEESLLNLPWDRFIAGVDLSASGAGTDQINAGYQEMQSGSVIVTGHHKFVHGPAGFSQIFVAGEFYLPAENVQTCGKTVCPAGQTCCNPSCGICVPSGGACVQMLCD